LATGLLYAEGKRQVGTPIHYSMAVYRRRLKMPLKGIKMPSKIFLGILKMPAINLT